MKKALFLIAAASAFGLAGPTLLAHTDDVLETQKAPNGGQLRMAGVYHYELVVAKDSKEAKDNAVVVYVTDHDGKKVATSGASGTATILAGKAKATATLAPDGDNRLKGMAKYLSSPDMKVVVSITVPGKAAEQARFTPLAAAKDGHTDHKH
ncbi:MAG: hypothetical protein LK562_00285 [Candidatus Accumulibacter phosphatis]|nr:hypothetical protein [Candidatus Accumulibacter phosphatis]